LKHGFKTISYQFFYLACVKPYRPSSAYETGYNIGQDQSFIFHLHARSGSFPIQPLCEII